MRTVAKDRLQEIIDRLVAEFHPNKIILFGSHAWGIPNKDSDLDLLVIVEQSDRKPVERAIRAYQCLNGLGIAKDILVKTHDEFERFRHVRASLEYKIAERGKVLYG